MRTSTLDSLSNCVDPTNFALSKKRKKHDWLIELNVNTFRMIQLLSEFIICMSILIDSVTRAAPCFLFVYIFQLFFGAYLLSFCLPDTVE